MSLIETFEKSSLMNSIFCLFQTRILQATQAVKTYFKLLRQKFQFIKLGFSNSIFQNPSTDRSLTKVSQDFNFQQYFVTWAQFQNLLKADLLYCLDYQLHKLTLIHSINASSIGQLVLLVKNDEDSEINFIVLLYYCTYWVE